MSKQNNAPSDKAMTKLAGPWQPLQAPAIKTIGDINWATKNPYQYGPDISTGFNSQQNQSLGAGEFLANDTYRSGLMGDATSYAGGIAAGGGVGAPGSSYVDAIASGGIRGPAEGDLNNSVARGDVAYSDLAYLKGTAAGDRLGTANPYLDSVIANASRDTTNALVPALEGRMAASGRLGSGVEGVGQGEIARQINQNALQQRYGDYATERGYQNQAGLALPGEETRLIANQREGAVAANQDAYSRIQQQLNAAGQSADAKRADQAQALEAGGALGRDYANEFIGADKGLAYGTTAEQEQEKLNAQAQDRFRYDQNASYDQIQRRLAAYNAIPGSGGSPEASKAYGDSLNRPSTFNSLLNTGIDAAALAAEVYAPYATPAIEAVKGGVKSYSYQPPGYDPSARY